MVSVKGAAFLVGFAAEARIAHASGWLVGMGGGTAAGAARAAQRLIDAGASALVSFGLAGGLDPALPAGTVIVAAAVLADGRSWPTDPALNARLGGSTGHVCLSLDHIAASTEEKRRLGRVTGAAVADMESGAAAAAAAKAGVPFAVLRAICDPADRPLPSAALVALNANGRIGFTRLAGSLLRDPGQMGALLRLARDAAAARRALRARVAGMHPPPRP